MEGFVDGVAKSFGGESDAGLGAGVGDGSTTVGLGVADGGVTVGRAEANELVRGVGAASMALG